MSFISLASFRNSFTIRITVIASLMCLLLIGVTIPALADPVVDTGLVDTEHAEYCLPDDPTSETLQPFPPMSPDRAALISQFQEPNLSATETAEILARYRSIDPTHVIPKKLLERGLVFYDVNKKLIPNPNRLSVVDFSVESRKVRFHIIDMATGEVVSIRVAHGKGSDPNNTGFATQFGNVPQSQMSSLGFYLTAEEYKGEEGDIRCRMDGLSQTNSNVRPRYIVIHQADYVEDANVKPGRSWGCLAVSVENHTRVVNELKEGSIILGGTH
ncbi:MAG: murein L,D-transpeptidase catalytic domain family protein [Candidatus Ozemobacteraceae bacterium]